MKRYRFHPDALAALNDSARFYDGKRPDLGEQFVDSVQKTVDRIRSGIAGGSPWMHGTRRQSVEKFPYGIVFRDFTDEVYIYAVYHFSRREDYWVQRLDDVTENE